MSEDGWSDETTHVSEIRDRLARFNKARDWEQFHQPRDLAMCLACEAGELLEAFLWKGDDGDVDLEKVQEEIADILICTVNLAQRLGIDLAAATDQKIRRNEEKYPVELARGNATKHDQLRRAKPDK